MKIEKIKLADLKPAKYNPRKDLKPGDAEYEKLRRSMDEFGYVEPIIWNKRTGNIIGGHQRHKILKDLGFDEVDCVVVDLDDKREKALNVALNKISGEFDIPLLTDLLKELDGSDFDVTLTGFGADELTDLFAKMDNSEAKDDYYDVTKALEESAFVKPGDVWLLGRHRMVCGDATKPDDVALLMDGKKANLCVTDVPYGVNYKSTSGLSIMNDNLKDKDSYDFLLASFTNIHESMDKEGSI